MAFAEKPKKKENKQIDNFQNKPMTDDDRLNQLENFMQRAISMFNNQGNALQAAMSKISQLSFKLGKTEEELHIVRISNRVQRDKLDTVMKTLTELGIIDDQIFDIVFSKIETKYLPINSEGAINGNVLMRRYNPPDDIPHPDRMMQI